MASKIDFHAADGDDLFLFATSQLQTFAYNVSDPQKVRHSKFNISFLEK